AYGDPGALLRSCHFPKVRSSPVNDVSVSASQDQTTRHSSIWLGDGGSTSAPGERSQYRVTTPKLPPPPPVCAHQRSRFGSSGSRVATTTRTSPFLSTTTTSTAYRWSATAPYRRDNGPSPPPAKCPPAPTSAQ